MNVKLTRRTVLAAAAGRSAAQSKSWSGRWAASWRGRQIGGTWVAREFKEPTAGGGAWSLLDSAGRALMTGTWGARKRETAWDGSWFGQVDGGRLYQGSWAARLNLSPKLPFSKLLEAGRKAMVRGAWESDGGHRGAWTIWTD